MKFTSVARINATIVALAAAAILFANLIGLVPDERQTAISTRIAVCQTLASNITFLVGNNEFEEIGTQLGTFADRTPELVSCGLRRADGALVASTGDHAGSWGLAVSKKSDGCFEVPIHASQAEWGKLEMHFSPVMAGMGSYISPNVVALLSILVPLIGLVGWLHLSRILRYLDQPLCGMWNRCFGGAAA